VLVQFELLFTPGFSRVAQSAMSIETVSTVLNRFGGEKPLKRFFTFACHLVTGLKPGVNEMSFVSN
jgi:hypothetical protein